MSIFKDGKARNALRTAGLMTSEGEPTSSGYRITDIFSDYRSEQHKLVERIQSLERALGYTYEWPSGARHVKIKKTNK